MSQFPNQDHASLIILTSPPEYEIEVDFEDDQIVMTMHQKCPVRGIAIHNIGEAPE